MYVYQVVSLLENGFHMFGYSVQWRVHIAVHVEGVETEDKLEPGCYQMQD